MRWLALFALLAGCDAVLGLERVTPPDAPPCSSPEVSDDFAPDAMVCDSWGHVIGNAALISRNSGMLAVAPMQGVADYAACLSNSAMTFGPFGIFLDLGQVATGNGYGIFSIATFTTIGQAQHDARSNFTVSTNLVGLADQDYCDTHPNMCLYYAMGPYVADQMKWLRWIPTNGGATITAQVSADGLTWMEFGHHDLTPPALANYITFAIGGGTGANGALGPPGITAYEHFDICPR